MLGIDKDIKVLKYETVLMQMNSILVIFVQRAYSMFFTPP